MTVVNKHTCSSPVVICVVVDVVVNRFNFFIVFLCCDVHNKVRVSVISGCQGNGVEDPFKDFSVASKVTFGMIYVSGSKFETLLMLVIVFLC